MYISRTNREVPMRLMILFLLLLLSACGASYARGGDATVHCTNADGTVSARGGDAYARGGNGETVVSRGEDVVVRCDEDE